MTTMILLLVAAVLLLVGSPPITEAFVPSTPPPSSAAAATAATATVGEALGSSLRRSSPPYLGSDHETTLGTFRSDRPFAEAVPLSSRGSGRRRNASIFRRNMFPSPRSVDGGGNDGVAGAGGGGECNWRVPRKIAARLGAGEGEKGGEGLFLPFEFELERAPPSSAGRRRASSAARGGGSFYFPGAAAGVAAASSSSSDAAADPKKKEAGASSSAPTKTSSSSSSLTQSPPRVVVRHLRESDLNEAVDMCVKEFGSYSDPDDDPFRRDSTVNGKNGSSGDDRLPGYVVSNRDDGGLTLGKILEPLWTAYENWAFSWVVRIGLYMRIVRSNEGFQHDHNVLCLVEKGEEKEEDEDVIAAIAELSLQPADPLRNAPPYVLPLSAKRAIGQKAGVGEPRAYVSNVLVRPDRRGRGYGRAVVAACEGLAQSWGCGDASLHVDADVDSGRAAQGLYRAMGYRGVVDEGGAGTSEGKKRPELKWMGPEMIQKGVYVVEGVPLLYMRKKLNDR